MFTTFLKIALSPFIDVRGFFGIAAADNPHKAGHKIVIQVGSLC
jgi:hypothetical protein